MTMTRSKYENRLEDLGFTDNFQITLPSREEYIKGLREKNEAAASKFGVKLQVSDERFGSIYDALMEDTKAFVYSEARKQLFPKDIFYNNLYHFFNTNFIVDQLNESRTYTVSRIKR